MGFGLHQASGGPVGGEVGQDSRRLEGQFMEMHVNRQGSTITIDTLLQWHLEGRVFHVQQGNAATLVDFVETTYDEDQPQLAIRVPTGTTIIPLSLITTCQDQAGTNNHVLWSVTTNDIGVGTSTALTISSMRTNTARTSQCAVGSLYTGNATAATGLFEFARWVDPFVATVTMLPRYEWNIRTAASIPIVVGPGTLQLHAVATGDGIEGFGEYVWAEFQTPDILKTV